MTVIHRLRNIGISAHIDSGKTTLTERMLFYCGRIHQMREVRGDDGGATMDFHELEKLHGITISSAVTRVEWNDHDINIIDTPGHVDFTIEVERSLRVLDGAVMVLCSVGGVQSQSLTVDRQMKRYGVPRIAFINKMDRAGANPVRVVEQMREQLNANAVLIQTPVFEDDTFVGVVDLVLMKAVYCTGESGVDVEFCAIPDDVIESATIARAELLENLSQFDDRLTECLVEGHEPDAEHIQQVIRQATIARQLTPVLLGSAYKNKGVQQVLDAAIAFLPSPADRKVYANDLSQTTGQATGQTADQSSDGQIELSCDGEQPLVAMAFKTTVDKFGQLTFMRVYQGRIRKGDCYVDAMTERSVRFSRLLRIHAGQQQDLSVAECGDIIGVVGVDCASGTTFLGDGMDCALENIFVPEPVIRLSIEPKNRNDSEKLAKALARFRREDPTFRVSTDSQTGQTLIAGMGQLHLEIYVKKIQRDFACECTVGSPRVTYKQRPTKAVDFNHKLDKQTGGPGQFAHVIGRMEPLPLPVIEDASDDDSQTFVFENEVTGGRIPVEFIPSVGKGFAGELARGPLGEFEVVGVHVRLQDGSFHSNDSSDLSFRQCAAEAMREMILPKAEMVLLEPVMKLDVEVPVEFLGSITGHVSSKRGVIKSTSHSESTCVVNAEVPLAELLTYATDIRSMTQGLATFSMEFLCYRKVPESVQRRITNGC